MSPWAKERTYLVSPINGVLKYHRLGNKEREDSNVPYEKASFVIADVSLTITEVQILIRNSVCIMHEFIVTQQCQVLEKKSTKKKVFKKLIMDIC